MKQNFLVKHVKLIIYKPVLIEFPHINRERLKSILLIILFFNDRKCFVTTSYCIREMLVETRDSKFCWECNVHKSNTVTIHHKYYSYKNKESKIWDMPTSGKVSKNCYTIMAYVLWKVWWNTATFILIIRLQWLRTDL